MAAPLIELAMYEITVEGRFSAAHRHSLPGGGEGLHGHDFLVLVRVRGSTLEDDVLVDFHAVEVELKRQLAALHHSNLSDDAAIGAHPTPAAIARFLHHRLAGSVPGLASVEVRDTEHTGARFSAPVPARG